MSKEAGLMQARKSLSSISANRDLWIAQYRQEVADRDRRSGLSAALRKGIEQGLAKGKEEGRLEGKYETARQMLSDRIQVEQIARWTGLSLSEIEKLSKG